MIDRVKMLKLCSYIVGGGILAISLLFIMQRNWMATGVAWLGALLLVLPCVLKGSEENFNGMASYMMVGINVMIFLITLLTNEILSAAPFLMSAGAISLLFFSTRCNSKIKVDTWKTTMYLPFFLC